VGILSQCFNRLTQCTSFVYSLRHYDDSIAAKWSFLFFQKELNPRYRNCTTEHLLGAWMSITIDALFCSKLNIENLRMDNQKDCLRLDGVWHGSELRKLHPQRFLALDSVELNIDPTVLQGVPYSEAGKIFDLFYPTPPSFTLRIGPCETQDAQLWGNFVLEKFVGLRGLRELCVEWTTPWTSSPLLLHKLANSSRGSLVSVSFRDIDFTTRELPALLEVLKKLTSENPKLAQIDLDYQSFQWISDRGVNYTCSLHLMDDRPHAYGSLLLQDEIGDLEAWARMVGIL